jgi:hypothetical protein
MHALGMIRLICIDTQLMARHNHHLPQLRWLLCRLVGGGWHMLRYVRSSLRWRKGPGQIEIPSKVALDAVWHHPRTHSSICTHISGARGTSKYQQITAVAAHGGLPMHLRRTDWFTSAGFPEPKWLENLWLGEETKGPNF